MKLTQLTSCASFSSKLRQLVTTQFNQHIPSFEQSQTQKIEDAGINFEVRTITPHEGKKPMPADKNKMSVNPFLPPFEKNVFITDLEPNHRLIFNKYCVVREHVLILTKQF